MSTDLQMSLVFSDLDGSLLDHETYSFAAAQPMLDALDRLGIPVILASSKTHAEILELRTALRNNHPFIVENGAGIYVPRHTFPQQPLGTEVQGDCWVQALTPPRMHWLSVLDSVTEEFPQEFDSFYSAGTAGIMAMTGLPEASAVAANQRYFSEPVRWLGSPQRETTFVQRLQEAGATVFKGGRFLSVSGDCDKGKALRWLRSQYLEFGSTDRAEDLAIGDSENDRPMLEAAKTALIIRSPAHDYPAISKKDSVIYSQQCGPAGWAEGVSRWLQSRGISV